MPSPTTPPWRSLDAPVPAADGVPPGSRGGPTDDSGRAGQRRIAAMVAGAAVFAALAFVLASTGGSSAEVIVAGGSALASPSVASSGDAPADASPADELVVEIVGAVRRPGVFRVAPGSRIGDLVEAAGGYGPRVDTIRAEQQLNLAGLLRDGDQVRVPSRDDPAATAAIASDGSQPATGPLDLNTATADQLDALPGIGPVTVEKILTAREEAPFASIDDLRTRGLIGEKTFERIRDAIMVR